MATIESVSGLNRRQFCGLAAGGVLASGLVGEARCGPPAKRVAQQAQPIGVRLAGVREGEDLFSYIRRVREGFDQTLYQQIVGAANE